MYMCICIYICVCVCIYIYIYTYIHTCVRVHVGVFFRIHVLIHNFPRTIWPVCAHPSASALLSLSKPVTPLSIQTYSDAEK